MGRVFVETRKPPIPRGMNSTERRYAERLEARRQAGEIRKWVFEGVRLKLGAGAWYKPDFYVVGPDRRIQLHEIKGMWREAARVRIKAAASAYPEIYFVAIRDVGGRWQFEEIPP